MNIVLRLAWRNLWRHSRRTWLTIGAMVFSNMLLVFMISLQFGMYGLMIDNSLKVFAGHMQVQAPGYNDDQKMRQVVPGVADLAESLREELGSDEIAARGSAFGLASSAERSYGIAVYGVEPDYEPLVSNIPGLVAEGRFFDDTNAMEVVIGATLARNLRVTLGDEITLLGSGVDGSFAAAVLTIVGIFDSGVPDLDRNVAEMPLGAFQEVFYMNGAGHQVVLFTDSLRNVETMRQRVEGLLPEDSELVVHDWDVLPHRLDIAQ